MPGVGQPGAPAMSSSDATYPPQGWRRPASTLWARRALAACLDEIENGWLTSTKEVRVKFAWAGPGDRISVIYQPPFLDRIVGCSRVRGSDAVLTSEDDVDGEPTAEGFGRGVADFDIGEPLGSLSDRASTSDSRVFWWGDDPLPDSFDG
jgi:hypothetical protein